MSVNEVSQLDNAIGIEGVDEKKAIMEVNSADCKTKINIESEDVLKLVEGILSSAKGKGKSMIKIQIEIVNE